MDDEKTATTKKTFPQLDVDTRILYERLIKTKVGEIVSYKELNDLIGRDVQKEAYHLLSTARRKALNENQMVLDAVPTVGIIRSDNTAKIAHGEYAITRIRRISRTSKKKILCVDDFDNLPNAEKIKHNTFLSVLGAFDIFTRPKNVKRIENKIEQAQDKLPFNKTLELFIQK